MPAFPVSVSLVIPSYNEGTRLPRLLEHLGQTLEPPLPVTVELIVVDDGSQEAHSALSSEAVARLDASLRALGRGHRARWVSYPKNRGKGFAVRSGWAEASPDAGWLGFADADGATGARELVRLMRMLASVPADVLAGSRVKMGGKVVERSALRHYQGRVFATIAELVFHLQLYDTQCGVKFFRAEVLRPLLGSLTEDRWLLDLEVLALLKARQARIVEEPIDWSDPGDSKVRPGIDAARMFRGIFRIKRTHRL